MSHELTLYLWDDSWVVQILLPYCTCTFQPWLHRFPTGPDLFSNSSERYQNWTEQLPTKTTNILPQTVYVILFIFRCRKIYDNAMEDKVKQQPDHLWQPWFRKDCKGFGPSKEKKQKKTVMWIPASRKYLVYLNSCCPLEPGFRQYIPTFHWIVNSQKT